MCMRLNTGIVHYSLHGQEVKCRKVSMYSRLNTEVVHVFEVVTRVCHVKEVVNRETRGCEQRFYRS